MEYANTMRPPVLEFLDKDPNSKLWTDLFSRRNETATKRANSIRMPAPSQNSSSVRILLQLLMPGSEKTDRQL